MDAKNTLNLISILIVIIVLTAGYRIAFMLNSIDYVIVLNILRGLLLYLFNFLSKHSLVIYL